MPKVAGEGESVLAACLVRTPKYEVRVSQVWGWDRAQEKPELEGWAAPFTW